MDLQKCCRELPKVELHAHLNGSLSRATMLQLLRYQADAGIIDKTNAFIDEFQMDAGDNKILADCFPMFSIAHSLTSTPETLTLATKLTLQEFQDDGCFYLEIRSTPKDTSHMGKEKYIETIVQAIQNSAVNLTMIACLIISINRNASESEVETITDIAIKYNKLYPNIVVGVEISGDPTVGDFKSFIPALQKAREAGLKITLHCGEVCNPREVLEMLEFGPDRIGHGVCIHPDYGGTKETWSLLCEKKIPVEICLTSNVNTKSTPDYDSHHFKLLFEAEVPVVLCTDDKGMFATSLSQEYLLCAETFNLSQTQLAKLALMSCQYVFLDSARKSLQARLLKFIDKNKL